jgi:signal peptidase I
MLSYLKPAAQFIWEVLKVALISLAIILPIRYFLVQPFYVKGASMEPNFLDHDYLLIDELSYRLREPVRGEVVVFRYPRNPSEYFIKRVIGLPGEHVVVKDNGVYVGQVGQEPTELPETYLGEWIRTVGSQDITLGTQEYFVLGDNRSASLDSRAFGPIKRSDIVGRAWLRAWPFDRWKYYQPDFLAP